MGMCTPKRLAESVTMKLKDLFPNFEFYTKDADLGDEFEFHKFWMEYNFNVAFILQDLAENFIKMANKHQDIITDLIKDVI